MSEAHNAGEGVVALRRELAAKGEELAQTLERLKLADARIHGLEAGAGPGAGASPAPVDDGDPFDAAACRARLVESGEDFSASRFLMIFRVGKIFTGLMEKALAKLRVQVTCICPIPETVLLKPRWRRENVTQKIKFRARRDTGKVCGRHGRHLQRTGKPRGGHQHPS